MRLSSLLRPLRLAAVLLALVPCGRRSPPRTNNNVEWAA